MPSLTMELVQGEEVMSRYNTYDLSSGSARTRWYMKRKNVRWLVCGAVILLVAAGIFLAGYYSGLGAVGKSSESLENKTVVEPPVDKEYPPVVWNGTCPETPLKCPESYQGIPPLLLVSLDGFRPDYMDEDLSPTLYKIFNCGTSAPFMYPVYPSKTFCSHYSQVTGLYPASHGIVDNSMYDPVKQAYFRPGNEEPFWWEKEPIWTTLEKKDKRTALYFWPGSDVKIDGIVPTHFKKYNKKTPFEKRVDQVLEWLELPVDKRPSFLTLYFSEPDSSAHRYGTDANETKQAVAKVDKMIARLFSGLQERNIVGCINIIIMSDHGMSNINCDQVIEIQNYINVSDIYTSLSTIGKLRPDNESEEEIENIINHLKCQNNHMRVYKKEQLPVRLHYADNSRIEPIIIDLDSSWTLSRENRSDNIYCSGGAHGYDNLFPDMRAIFMAHGPSFKKNNRVRPFINIELYELMTELVNITANPNNGTKGSLHHMLNFHSTLPQKIKPLPPPIGEIPDNEEDYDFFVYAAMCSCKQTFKQTMVGNVTESSAFHMPFGIPESSEKEAALKLLYHEDYIAAYDSKYRLPMWSSFTLVESKNISEMKEVCWKGDSRVGKDTSECADYGNPIVEEENLIQRPLYFPYFSNEAILQEEATYVTNSVPKHLNHTNHVEHQFYEMLNSWASESQLNVVMGPAFDLLATGVKPDVGTIMQSHMKFGPLVGPTHYFAVVTWCEDKSETLTTCISSNLETTAFLLPNTPFPWNCELPNAIIAKNVARVVDVEKLTGLSFFANLSAYDAIRLRTMMPTRVPR